MKKQMKESNESRTTKYYQRFIKRLIVLALLGFVLFMVIMAIIWAVPRIWHWAL
jgi:hypothetical protein